MLSARYPTIPRSTSTRFRAQLDLSALRASEIEQLCAFAQKMSSRTGCQCGILGAMEAPRPKRKATRSRSFRISLEADRQLRELADYYNAYFVGVVELAIRKEWERVRRRGGVQ